jgi:predicted dehydrogenase/threonine dehydrogenase-like Zn-dependent dehydrogenase
LKQILQSLKTGTTELADVPVPRAARGQLLVKTSRTLVSAGTERMLVEFGKASLLDKARQQPDKVRQVLDKVRTDGLVTTFEAVQCKLDQPLALGYCNVGVVVDVGSGVSGFSVGDRVVSNGKHAEVVAVPVNLCARIPDPVDDDSAVFTVLAAIGLQGIRLAQPTLGECVVVTGLGLIGLITLQLLRAQGCRVMGIDVDPARLELALRLGAESVANPAAGDDVLMLAESFSRGRGIDAVLITASTVSSEPVSQAAKMCRKRGRIVLVGVTGLELSRADFYEKELSFQVSCSYGPGRYDPVYEEQGQDYPVGFVRWTEQRNFEAVLDMMASRALNVLSLVSHRFSLVRAVEAYELLSSNQPSLGIVLEYPPDAGELIRTVSLSPNRLGSGSAPATAPSGCVVAFLGAGNYAGRVLMPAFKSVGAELHSVVSGTGVSAVHFGRKFGFAQAATTEETVLRDSRINTLVIATRHDAHAAQVISALEAGKDVFVEKPLCLTVEELNAITATARARPTQRLMVGFNRRFAPQIVKIKALLSRVNVPKAMVMTVNAGAIPPGHWTQDDEVGGGRIVGEACHFIDLLRFLAGVEIVDYDAHFLAGTTRDSASLHLRFGDGSIGTVHYLANGAKSFPKERLEVFAGGAVLQLDNFRRLQSFGWPGFRSMNLWRQDKGQEACAAAFVKAVTSGSPSPIPIEEVLEVSRVAISMAELGRS